MQQQSMRAGLYFTNGPLAGKEIPVEGMELRIGSDASVNTIVVSHESILPEHARIIWYNGQFVLQGLRPNIPLYVNQQIVSQSRVLANGDTITLGQAGIACIWSMASPTGAIGPNATATSTGPIGAGIMRSNIAAGPIGIGMATPAATGSEKINNSTRYLCAAVYMDEGLSDYIQQTVVKEKHRALGESFGVDIERVVKWSNKEQSHRLGRDIVLSITFLFAVLAGFASLIIIFLGSVESSFGALAGLASLAVLGSIFGSLLGLVFYYIIVAMFVPKRMRKPFYNIAALLWLALLTFWTPLTIPLFLIGWGVVFFKHWRARYGHEIKLLSAGTQAQAEQEPLPPQVKQMLSDNFHSANNLIAYSGYAPFAGSGMPVEAWSFAINVSQSIGDGSRGEAKVPEDVSVGELYDCVKKAALGLKLPNLEVLDRLYTRGRGLRDDPSHIFLRDRYGRPSIKVSNEVLEYYKTQPMETEKTRYYQCIRVTSWDGELVLSFFVRFTKTLVPSARKEGTQEEYVFVEFNTLLLPPLYRAFYEIDDIQPGWNMRKILQIAKETFFPAIQLWLRSPSPLLSRVMSQFTAMKREAREKRSIDDSPAYDYGVKTSLRQEASPAANWGGKGRKSRNAAANGGSKNFGVSLIEQEDDEEDIYHLYFQRLDKEMYYKILERQIFDHILALLKKKNIDVTEFMQRQSQILNSNTFVNSGNFNISGDLNQANKNTNMYGRGGN